MTPDEIANGWFLDETARDRHVYINGDGGRLPSVSTILGHTGGGGLEKFKIAQGVERAGRFVKAQWGGARPPSIAALKRVASDESEDSVNHARVGSALHEYALGGDEGWSERLNAKEQGYYETAVRSWEKFLRDCGGSISLPYTEQVIANEQDGYAGTLDAIWELPTGESWLLELKSSARIYHNYALQAAAYARAFPLPLDGAIIIRVSKFGEAYYDFRRVDMAQAWSSFEGLLRYHYTKDVFEADWENGW